MDYSSDIYTDNFQHISDCPGTKKITQTLVIDDGTGKLYNYVLDKSLTWIEYTITPDFSTNPEEPTILETTDIIPGIDDPFDVVETDGVDYNFTVSEELNKQEDETVQQVLPTPVEQDITQTVRYFTGWEIKTNSITKTITKTNIPPQVCNTISSSGICTPKHIFTSCSTDAEDTDPQSLKIDWRLYFNINSIIVVDDSDPDNVVRTVDSDGDPEWEELSYVEDNPVFEWIYSQEGQFKLTEYATDTADDTSSVDRFYDVLFETCGEDTTPEDPDTFSGHGTVEVEAGKWQILAFPLENRVWDSENHTFVNASENPSNFYNCIVKQLEDRYDTDITNLIQVANAMVGDSNETFWNYIPGFTKETSEHNFPLVYVDENDDASTDTIKKEIVGFWIKSKADFTFTIEWSI